MPSPKIPPETLASYDRGDEAPRLFAGLGRLELARTQELILRHLTARAHYFTTAFFHPPDELAEETRTAGWAEVRVLAIEGVGELAKDFDRRWEDLHEREIILQAIRDLEREPSPLGVSAHLLAGARA